MMFKKIKVAACVLLIMSVVYILINRLRACSHIRPIPKKPILVRLLAVLPTGLNFA